MKNEELRMKNWGRNTSHRAPDSSFFILNSSFPSFPPYIIAGKRKGGPDEGKEEIEDLRGDASPCPGMQGIKEPLPFLGGDEVEDIPEPFPPPREGPNQTS